jgi:CheY-like chemotaxis protein
MQPQNHDFLPGSADETRRSVHDIAAAIISVRALAETLADHLPTLVAMSRAKYLAQNAQIPPTTLDALPSFPTEILKLCEIMRGSLKAIGNGEGATNGVSEPLHGNPPSRWRDSPTERVNESGPAVLLVEDEDTVRYVISQTLKGLGCQVTGISDGEDALRLLEERNFDLVLMDLRIPRMSGCETTARIRKRESAKGRHTRIVGLTASPLIEDQQRAKDAGMDDVIVKPLDETILQSVLRGLQPS